jgi:uncharacterized protein (TIGR02466 family)
MKAARIKNDEQSFTPAEKYVVDYIFPTPFLRGELDLPHELVAQDCRKMIDFTASRDDEPRRNYTTYFDQEARVQLLDYNWYNTFSNVIKDTYIQFINQQWHHDVSYISRHDIHLFSWISLYSRDDFHDFHNHVNSLLSGTYYVLAEDDAQPIKFLNPSICTIAGHKARDGDMENFADMWGTTSTGTTGTQSDLIIHPRTGQFCMWPSYLLHGVGGESNLPEDYERIALSFNLMHNEPLSDTESGDELSYEFIK